MMPNPFAPPFPAAAWAEEDAAKSKLCLEDMRASAFAGPGTEWWPDIDIWDFSGEKPKKVKQSTKMYVQAYYRIPYWSLDGTPLELMYSRKVKYKDDAPAEARKNKYVRSSALYAGYEASIPYFHPQRLDNAPAPIVDIHEGEKKAACAAVACGQQAIGIGGNWSWVDPEHKRTKKLHPWIKQDIARVQALFPDQRVRVRLWPDGDFRTNSDVRDG